MSPRALRIIVRFVPFLFAFLAQATLADQSRDFKNIGGALSESSADLSLTGSILDAIAPFSGTPAVGRTGIVSFPAGVLVSGSVQMGAIFARGVTFTISGTGTSGIVDGVLFSGAFTGPVSWTLTTLANGTHNYILTAVVTGIVASSPVRRVSVQLTVNTGKGFFNGSTTMAGEDTTVVSFVPEPSTLAMLSTGLLAIAGGVRRRLIG